MASPAATLPLPLFFTDTDFIEAQKSPPPLAGLLWLIAEY
jgi:hypothetical protein